MFRINFIEKLKLVFHIGRKNKIDKREMFIAARNLINNGKIESQGCVKNTIISDIMVSKGEINFKE